MLTLVRWHLGHADQAKESSRQCLEHTRSLDHVNSLGYAVAFADGCFGGLSRDVDILELGDGGAAGARPGPLAADLDRGRNRIARQTAGRAGPGGRGDWRTARRHREAVRHAHRPAAVDVHRLAGDGARRTRRGRRGVRRDRRLVGGRQDRRALDGCGAAPRQGELHLVARQPDRDAAERSFREALAIARRQGARVLELRAAGSLARLWREQGRAREAHALLAPAVAWFTEGRDTADLREAEALLRTLA